MGDVEEEYSLFLAGGGLCSLFIDDELPENQEALQAFLDSDVPGVVIPTSGLASARLVCGQEVFEGKNEILPFIVKAKNR